MVKIPDYYEFLTMHDLNTPLGLYDFIQDMIMDNVNLDDYIEIKVYYEVLYNNAFRDDPNMISVDYVVKKLKNALIRYGFAHTVEKLKPYGLYYYWNSREV